MAEQSAPFAFRDWLVQSMFVIADYNTHTTRNSFFGGMKIGEAGGASVPFGKQQCRKRHCAPLFEEQ
ncbi:MAG: hypothetical protein ABID61_04045 [Candidatus Micrarchaeota archaeon]